MRTKTILAVAITTSLVATLYACTANDTDKTTDANKDISETRMQEDGDKVSRGRYLVSIVGSCGDCHSPKIFSAQGISEDTTKLLSGHPAGELLPPVDRNTEKPGQWIQMSGDATVFAGPWGVSYTANLTPDSATGIGAWTEEVFIKTLRTGKHLGQESGRPILPPMPWYNIGRMTDDDLSAVYAYLRSLPPVNNKVPAPTPPAGAK